LHNKIYEKNIYNSTQVNKWKVQIHEKKITNKCVMDNKKTTNNISFKIEDWSTGIKRLNRLA